MSDQDRTFLKSSLATASAFVPILLASVLLFSSQAFAAGLYNLGAFWGPTFVHLPNDTQATQSTTSTITLPVTATGQNNLLIVGLGWCCNGSSHIPTISDSKGNTWTLAARGATKTVADDSADNIAIAYAVSATAGVTTLSIAPNTEQYVSVIYGEFSGDLTSGVFDNARFELTGSNPVVSTALTPSHPGELIICVSDDDEATGTGVVLGSSFTAIGTGYSAVSTAGLSMSYLVSGGVAPVTCTYNYPGGSSSDVSIIETAAFVPSR
jgi:hypothetical protein